MFVYLGVADRGGAVICSRLFVRTDRSIFTRGSVRRERTVARAVFPVYPRTQPLQEPSQVPCTHIDRRPGCSLSQMKASSVPSKTLLSTKQRGGGCGNPLMLAFLFLCEDSIATEPLWREFFEAAGDWRSLASVYVHIGSQNVTRLPATSFFSGHEIAERVRVVWGDGSIMRATVALLRAALKAPCNARFALLSNTCAPLHPLRCMHSFLMRARRSFVEHRPSLMLRNRYAPCLGLSARQPWRKGANWVVLMRRLATQTVAALSDWRRACGANLPHLDEHLVQNLDLRTGLKLAIPGHTTSSGSGDGGGGVDAYNATLTHFRFGSQNKLVTYKGKPHYAHWHAATVDLASLRSHPTLRAACTFGTAAREGARHYAGPDACANASSDSFGPCFLFVRKVPATHVAPFRQLLHRGRRSRMP